jgi:hypothetical protein
MAGNFVFQAAGTNANTTSTLSLTPVLPSGLQANDAMFLLARGQTGGTSMVYTPPAGWTELGSRLAVTTTGVQPNVSLQLFWKAHSGTESNPTVTTTTSVPFTFSAAVFAYRGAAAPVITVACVDNTAAASSAYTGPSVTAASDARLIHLPAQAGTFGSGFGVVAANGYTAATTTQYTSNVPRAQIFDQAVTAGTYSGPSLSSSFSTPWLSKTFGLDAEFIGVGWSVGMIRY